MSGRGIIIASLFILAALGVGIYCGFTIGAQVGRAEVAAALAPDIAANQANLAALHERVTEQLNDARGMMTFLGLASHYGENEHGNMTAIMEIFDKNELTAASKFLPFNSYWLVTNLENGKQVAIRINDDGPNIPLRMVDLSDAAATRLEMKHRGVIGVSMIPIFGLTKDEK